MTDKPKMLSKGQIKNASEKLQTTLERRKNRNQWYNTTHEEAWHNTCTCVYVISFSNLKCMKSRKEYCFLLKCINRCVACCWTLLLCSCFTWNPVLMLKIRLCYNSIASWVRSLNKTLGTSPQEHRCLAKAQKVFVRQKL